MKNDDSQVKLRDDKVVWVINGRTKFSIPITDIKVIGEFTTDNGPYLEDWFLTIITLGDWYEIPMDTNGVDKLLIDLGQNSGRF